MLVLGIDIGGMSIKFALVNEKGEVVTPLGRFTTIREIQEATALKIGAAINSYLKENNVDKKDVIGIGIGCPGSINSKAGLVKYSNNLNWSNLKLAEILEKETGLPVKITNDANAAALGEIKFGAGKKYKDAIMLTLGTGVGGGIIIDGELYEGNESGGAELGHISLDINSPLLCTCGRRGCFEVYASATALIRQTKEGMLANYDSVMWKLVNNDLEKVDGKTIFDAMLKDDKTAKEVFKNYIKYLGEGVLNYCNIFRPEAIVFSGGIANQGDVLLNPLKKYCKEKVWGYGGSPEVELLIAELGYNSGIIGAASLFL